MVLKYSHRCLHSHLRARTQTHVFVTHACDTQNSKTENVWMFQGGGGQKEGESKKQECRVDRWHWIIFGCSVARAENGLCTWSPAPTSISCLSVWTPSAIFGDCCSIATKRFNVRQSNPATICSRYTVFTHLFVSFFFCPKGNEQGYWLSDQSRHGGFKSNISMCIHKEQSLYIRLNIIINIQCKKKKKTAITNDVWCLNLLCHNSIVTIRWGRTVWGRFYEDEGAGYLFSHRACMCYMSNGTYHFVGSI